MSTGRVGTETLARLFSLSPYVQAYHELRPQLLEERKKAYGEVWSKPSKYIYIFSRARAWPIAKARFQKRIYIETSARLTFFVPVIANLMPRSKFIYLYRHPGDVVRSGMRRRWYDRHSSDVHRVEPFKNDPFHNSWRNLDPFRRICWYWDAYNRFSLKAIKYIKNRRIFKLRSEDLFNLDMQLFKKLFQFIGVPTPSYQSIFEVLNARYNTQIEHEYPIWKDWDDQHRMILYSIAGETMKKLGYKL